MKPGTRRWLIYLGILRDKGAGPLLPWWGYAVGACVAGVIGLVALVVPFGNEGGPSSRVMGGVILAGAVVWGLIARHRYRSTHDGGGPG